jgi:two-component system CheB/CheR fusion protein
MNKVKPPDTANKAKTADATKKSKSNPAPAESAGEAPSTGNNFPIVGVGASAGGLEAFMELLKALPPKTGMAFVLVPHLDPTHESAMSELLGRATRMPVREVEQGMRVKPDHVYVIPPGRQMTITGGILQLAVRQQSHPPLPIDIFFRSLAEDQRNNAVGIILSGTASDGTLGMTAIKGEGGITFAQDPKTAKYDGMPSSAIGSGAVDFILAPAKIAAELERIRSHPYIANGQDEEIAALPPEADHDLTQLFRILKQTSKVDFSDYKPGTIRRRILRRMALRRLSDLREYLTYLREHREEAEALYNDILINVTNFFRNPEVFGGLKEIVYPALLKDRAPGDTIRIWVPGCSTGEEAYSHAISIVEYLSEIRADVSVQIFATDLSEAAVQRARSGIYKETISTDISATRLRRFFNKVEGGYQISKTIRDLCIFARQNVFRDPPFSKMDIVSCRNLLIYLGPALQKRVIPIFHYALRPHGYLMLGNTEGLLGQGAELFELVDKKHKIYVKRAIATPINFGFSIDRIDAGAAEHAARESNEPESPKVPMDLQREADRLLLAKYVPPAVVVNEQLDILQTRGHTGRFLELSPGKASLNLLRMARPGLLFELQKAVESARSQNAPVRRQGVQVEFNGDRRMVDVEISPFKVAGSADPNFLIVFHEANSRPAAAPSAAARSGVSREEAEQLKDKQIEQLKQELSATKEYLQSIIEEREATNEELQSANEEIQSGNEELQSTNEELQTSKEELESANEELNTVNEEMQHRNQQLAQLNNDLINLLNSVNIPIVMLGPDLSVRRFTVQAEKLLGLSAVDVGRPISNIRLKLSIADLEQWVEDVIRDVIPKQVEFTVDRASYSLRITPYRTSDNKIEGAVLVLLETTEFKQGAAEAAKGKSKS